jgi:hypothetical protein
MLDHNFVFFFSLLFHYCDAVLGCTSEGVNCVHSNRVVMKSISTQFCILHTHTHAHISIEFENVDKKIA